MSAHSYFEPKNVPRIQMQLAEQVLNYFVFHNDFYVNEMFERNVSVVLQVFKGVNVSSKAASQNSLSMTNVCGDVSQYFRTAVYFY